MFVPLLTALFLITCSLALPIAHNSSPNQSSLLQNLIPDISITNDQINEPSSSNNQKIDVRLTNTNYYITVSGSLTDETNFQNSIKFSGTVASNILYASSPSVGNIGAIALANNGKLYVVANDDAAAENYKWTVSGDGHIGVNGFQIISCPEADNHTYLYAAASCPKDPSTSPTTATNPPKLVYNS